MFFSSALKSAPRGLRKRAAGCAAHGPYPGFYGAKGRKNWA